MTASMTRRYTKTREKGEAAMLSAAPFSTNPTQRRPHRLSHREATVANALVNDPGGSRTRDLRIKSPLLYQLSYRVWTQQRHANSDQQANSD